MSQPPPPRQPYQPFIPASALPGNGMPNLPPGYTLGPPPVVWHSAPLLLGTCGAAVLSIVLMIVAMANFPSTPDTGGNVAFGVFLIFDLLAIAITALAMAGVERRRRRDPARRAASVNRRLSVFAILALVFSVMFTGFFLTTGLSELSRISGGLRAQYVNIAIPAIFTGVPWVLGTVFGAWGFRPGANRVTNVIALVALGLGLLMMVPLVVGTFAVATGAAS